MSSKLYEELQSKHKRQRAENVELKKKNEELSSAIEVVGMKLTSLQKAVEKVKADIAFKEKEYHQLQEKYKELNNAYEFLLEDNNILLTSSEVENRQLMKRLQDLQKELQVKEDSLTTEQNHLEYLSKELQKRKVRVYELESLIIRKDSIINYVRKRVMDALFNFHGKGLTVELKDDGVYVLLENSLLFPSARWTVKGDGRQALEQLAVALAENPSLNVMVEGHTDSDAFNGHTIIKDNWDLSVMRATSIVKILIANEGVKPEKITAAGRSEYIPVADNNSPEGKAQNRRTEIIITPDLSKLVDLLEEVK